MNGENNMLNLFSEIDNSNNMLSNIFQVMKNYNIPPLPRNYELIYNIFLTKDKEFMKSFEDLCLSGKAENQINLDKIYEKYINIINDNRLSNIYNDMSTIINNIRSAVKSGAQNKEKYKNILKTGVDAILDKPEIEVIQNVASLIVKATESVVLDENKQDRSLSDSSRTLNDLETELEKYKRMAYIEPLTGAYNRRSFDNDLKILFDKSFDSRKSGLILFDIDYFKKFNDQFGHQIGDKVLKLVSTFSQGMIGANKNNKSFYRIGGEEFAFIINNETEEEIFEFAEKIRQGIKSKEIRNVNSPENDYGRITISIGICMASNATDADDIFKKADNALYNAKNTGRDNVKTFEENLNLNNKI